MIPQLNVQLDQLVMILFIGKQQFLVPPIHHLKEESSFSTSTFLQTTPSNPQNLHSLPESTTQTSTAMGPSAWTFWGHNGPLHSQFQRFCCPFARCYVTPIRTTHWCLKSRGCTKLTSPSTTSVPGSGLGNMQCEQGGAHWEKHFPFPIMKTTRSI